MSKNKKSSLLYIALGAVVAIGAIMGASRLFFRGEAVDSSEVGGSVEEDSSDLNNESTGGDNEVDRSKLGVSALQAGINVEGYELMLAYEDADKILKICRSAMEKSDSTVFEPGYTYYHCSSFFKYADPDMVQSGYANLVVFYDYSENPEDDVLLIEFDGEAIVTVRKTGIFGQATGFILPENEKSGEGMFYDGYPSSTKLVYGVRSDKNEEDIVSDYNNDGIVCMPDEIVELVRLVER